LKLWRHRIFCASFGIESGLWHWILTG
jgi:hypothetical protein